MTLCIPIVTRMTTKKQIIDDRFTAQVNLAASDGGSFYR